jgi:hydrogenase maturation protein HypF
MSRPARNINQEKKRLCINIQGAVQGVGFRPFIYRLATEMELSGWVNNSPQGVTIEIEGTQDRLEDFVLRISGEKPPRAYIQSLEHKYLDSVGYSNFEIRKSDDTGAKSAMVLPDISTCPDCLAEVYDPDNRRYLYPFTNCTNCGPRYSIIRALPYDRPNTSMNIFAMCPECLSEYENPRDRRFHAQPNACPVCGPHLELWNPKGNILQYRHDSLLSAVEHIKKGSILAIKGLGGFNLVVDARNDEAVEQLRRLKSREEKPFALIYPSIEQVRNDCLISAMEERLLLSPESPIVLLKRIDTTINNVSLISSQVAPRNPYLGVMLPYTPLHHILMRELGFPIVATSGNISDEPICIDEKEALVRLQKMADLFLVHDRPIIRPIDDSIVRIMMGREMVVRRARGYAPLPIQTDKPIPSIIAVGAHLKNAIAASIGNNIFVSQHIGDLDSALAYQFFEKTIEDFRQLYELHPELMACDLHPVYLSGKYARKQTLRTNGIQHHYAHILSCMVENQISPPVMGVAWDGTGYGLDNTIWGGEFLSITNMGFERLAYFRPFLLPGGDQAIKEPRRIAAGMLYEMSGKEIFGTDNLLSIQSLTCEEKEIIAQMLEKKLNSYYTSSAGRIFDAVASILGICQFTRFEGQAAMELEFAADGAKTDDLFSYTINKHESSYIIDWAPLINNILKGINNKIPTKIMAAMFHNTMAEIIVEIAKLCGQKQIALSGGCFQNKYLTEKSIRRLMDEGFTPYWHQRIPPNDGGIAVGQIWAATINMQKE